MNAVVVDTHAIIWYFLQSKKLSATALAAIENSDLVYIATISVVEIIYLQEKGKIPNIALQQLNQALTDTNTGWLVMPLNIEIAQSITQIPRDVVPEMADRIIAATAFYLNLPLVTCDSKIHSLNIQIVW
jgi:PIN domain nuclease of toxin-antitoxin system